MADKLALFGALTPGQPGQILPEALKTKVHAPKLGLFGATE
jgi:hypothetical protein